MTAVENPSSDPITAALAAICAELLPDGRGEVPTYIPELAEVDPRQFGASLVSLGGHVYQAGDADVAFTMQSISKPFVFALALADVGLDGVLAHVGTEPSGEAFNAISLDPATGRPANPMINAGAIVTTSLVKAPDSEERFRRIQCALSAFAGHDLFVDDTLYRSEQRTGDRNRALAYLMRNAGSLTGDVDEVLDVYFRQCALLVTSCDLAVMAATLANGGRNPLSGDQVVAEEVAEHTCAVMATCGMYDYAGEWLLRVGLPAKSGVSGGLVAVSPGQFGIGMFSPPLDQRGNSVRAVEASRMLAERFSLHLLHRPRLTAPVVFFDEHTAAPAAGPSNESLEGTAGRIVVLGLQGDVEFTAAEFVLRTVEPLRTQADWGEAWLVIDLERVTRLHPVAAAMLGAMVRDLTERGTSVIVADPLRRHLLPAARIELTSIEEARRHCVGRHPGGEAAP